MANITRTDGAACFDNPRLGWVTSAPRNEGPNYPSPSTHPCPPTQSTRAFTLVRPDTPPRLSPWRLPGAPGSEWTVPARLSAAGCRPGVRPRLGRRGGMGPHGDGAEGLEALKTTCVRPRWVT
jgi:hypothetical protein